MRKALVVFALFLFSCTPPNRSTTPVQSDEQAILEQFKTVAALTVVLSDGRNVPYCSGVFVASYVLTAAHCVIDENNNVDSLVSIGTFEDYDQNTGTFSKTYEFFPTAVWDVEDIALLAPIDPMTRAHHGTARVSTENVTYGDRVRAFGNPRGYFYYFSHGEVVTPKRYITSLQGEGRMPYTLINAATYPGMSGGPIFNTAGEVIGLVSWGWRGESTLIGISHRESLEAILHARGVM